jgi:excisionase family DNA binding protein
VAEISRDLGISRARVYGLLEGGEIPNVRLGRGWLVTREAYEMWKRSCGLGPGRGKN